MHCTLEHIKSSSCSPLNLHPRVLVASIPSKVRCQILITLQNPLTPRSRQRRNLLRLTAKSTQFGKRTFTSWLIESAGTVPLQRRKDFPDGQVDNAEVMHKLLEVRRMRWLLAVGLTLFAGSRIWRCSMSLSGRHESVPPHHCAFEDRW